MTSALEKRARSEVASDPPRICQKDGRQGCRLKDAGRQTRQDSARGTLGRRHSVVYSNRAQAKSKPGEGERGEQHADRWLSVPERHTSLVRATAHVRARHSYEGKTELGVETIYFFHAGVGRFTPEKSAKKTRPTERLLS